MMATKKDLVEAMKDLDDNEIIYFSYNIIEIYIKKEHSESNSTTYEKIFPAVKKFKVIT